MIAARSHRPRHRPKTAKEAHELLDLLEAAQALGQIGAPMVRYRPVYFRSFAASSSCPGGTLTSCLEQCAGKGQRCRLACSMNCSAARGGRYWAPMTLSAGAGLRAVSGLGQEASQPKASSGWRLLLALGVVAAVAAHAAASPVKR